MDNTPSQGGEPLWEFASARGMGRRQFLWLMLAGGATAVLAACVGIDRSNGRDAPTAAQGGVDAAADSPFFKDSAPFIVRDDKGLEARMENMQGLITPNRYFFVRNNAPASLDLDASDWRLVVEGDGVSLPIKLTYQEVTSLPSHSLISYLECAGNHRAMFGILKGQESSGTQWMTGAVGNGEWVGARLSDVLTLAGVRDDAVSVLLVGLDTESPEEGFRFVLPVEKAMHPDTLLAYAMNGEPLPQDHGFPLRAVVPGWVGSSHIKWLGRIIVSTEQLWTRNNTTSYTLIGDAYPPEGESEGVPVTEQAIKSALALPWPAEFAAGRQRIHGYAHSPKGPITRVEWSADGGRTWDVASVSGTQPDYSWARFEFEWDASSGEHTIMT
ncbi:MAG: molybdopterin-dependent oxidoreductase, partial [Chloroflexota bacterium]|nr:molybdopterin-dependent oxidoreductase [Chloroflexota bacterium]